MTPLPLFDHSVPALARASDPRSSDEAAQELRESGRWGLHLGYVYQLVLRLPGATAHELERRSDKGPTVPGYEKVSIDYYGIVRRLNDLAHRERVYRGNRRECKVSGRVVLTWWPEHLEGGR